MDKKRQGYSPEYYQAHKEKIKASNKRYRLAHPLIYKQSLSRRNKKRYREYQRKVFFHYSNGTMVCAHCGFDDIRALSIDHINGGGEKDRRICHKGGHEYQWLIKHNFPPGIQILCMNCQFIKRHTNKEFPNISNKTNKSKHTLNYAL